MNSAAVEVAPLRRRQRADLAIPARFNVYTERYVVASSNRLCAL
jgi:hypothetical protein